MHRRIFEPISGLDVLASESQPCEHVEVLALTIVQASIGDTSILGLLAHQKSEG